MLDRLSSNVVFKAAQRGPEEAGGAFAAANQKGEEAAAGSKSFGYEKVVHLHGYHVAMG